MSEYNYRVIVVHKKLGYMYYILSEILSNKNLQCRKQVIATNFIKAFIDVLPSYAQIYIKKILDCIILEHKDSSEKIRQIKAKPLCCHWVQCLVLGITNTISIYTKHRFCFRKAWRIINFTDSGFSSTFP